MDRCYFTYLYKAFFFFAQNQSFHISDTPDGPSRLLTLLQLLKFARANSLEVRDQSLVLVQLYIK